MGFAQGGCTLIGLGEDMIKIKVPTTSAVIQTGGDTFFTNSQLLVPLPKAKGNGEPREVHMKEGFFPTYFFSKEISYVPGEAI